ncbi:MAG: NTP transferase domain-containing protein [Deltaproteobacteria bacterium]|nr:NTP transferase domain-containing protein [Deltaproteobacteria bacterium]
MEKENRIASIILAAGRGSRMKGYGGAKTLLPLIPETSPYSGKRPIILHIIENLPPGPKAVVVNHKKDDIREATQHLDITYCEQPVLNGTGGALLAAMPFLQKQGCQNLLITMGDVPFVAPETYASLLRALETHDLVVLGFMPEDKKQYGVLEIRGNQVRRIVEWKYWKHYSAEDQKILGVCNSGIYAAKKDSLLHSLAVLASKPHMVQKEVNGVVCDQEEFFITDLVEYLPREGHSVGYIISDNEKEVMGIDDLSSLLNAQKIYKPPSNHA